MLVQRLRRWPNIRSTQGQRTGPAGVGPTLNLKMAQIRMITVTFQGIVNSSWKITVDLNSP